MRYEQALQAKKWLTLADSARHLSIVFGENVSEADILRLGLDGRLQLSIHLVNGAYARPCLSVKPEEIEFDEVALLDGKGTISVPKNGRFWGDEHGTFQVWKVIMKLESGVWDLPLIGGERIDVEHMYQILTAGPPVTSVSLDGVFVASTDGGLHEIQARVDGPDLNQPFEHFENFHPAGRLPEDCVLVVCTKALADLELSVSEPQVKAVKPLTNRERESLLTIIGVLNVLIQSPRPDRESDASVIGEMVANYSDKEGISKRNLESKFAEAKRILDAR